MILKDSVAFLVLRLVGSLSQAVTLILVARATDLKSFGRLGVILAICLIAVTVVDFGMSTYVVKVRSSGDTKLLASALWLSSCASWSLAVGGVIICMTLLPFLGTVNAILTALLLIAAALERYVDCASGVPMADERRWFSASLLTVRRVLCLVIVATGISLAYPTLYLYGVASLTGTIVTFFMIHHYLKVAGVVRLRIREVEFKILFSQGWPFFVALVGGQLRQLDVVIVSAVAGGSSAGIYAAASRLSSPLIILSGAIGLLVFPRALRQDRSYRTKVTRLCIASLVASLVVVAALAFASDAIMQTVFGPSYATAGVVLVLTLCASLLIATMDPISRLLQATDAARLNGRLTVGAIVVSLLLAACGAALYGPAGAAGGMAVGYALRLLVSLKILAAP